MSARHFVEVRKTPGGPAPEETARALESSRATIERDRGWLIGMKTALSDAEGRRRGRSRAL
jgi:hypothetical protein